MTAATYTPRHAATPATPARHLQRLREDVLRTHVAAAVAISEADMLLDRLRTPEFEMAS